MVIWAWGLAWRAEALSLLTYNVGGYGAVDWSTNAPQVQAIARQLQWLQPDVVTFNEVPFTNSWEMTNFIRAFLPGYTLAMNSGTDGYLRSAILSRFPIRRSQKWLDGVSLTNFGFAGRFTRDLFEAEIQVPGYESPLHVFTTHLKAGQDPTNQLRRAAEASAITNFLATNFLAAYGHRPYVLTGDLNEDVFRPPAGSLQPVQRLLSPLTGLRLTTPVNPVTGDDRTLSIRTGLYARYDYILPCAALFSNIATSQVFRTDLLEPLPPGLLRTDSATASDHLPVWMRFNPLPIQPFALAIDRLGQTNRLLSLSWLAQPGRQYRVETSLDLVSWTSLTTNLLAQTNWLAVTVSPQQPRQFFRVLRLP
jgi:endonuclease/exonuclease/phosphatase family metal-dependent hydrolase